MGCPAQITQVSKEYCDCQNNLQVQYNLSKFQCIFHRNTGNKLKFQMALQKLSNSKNDLEKEEQSWRHHTSLLEIISM
jgi:hypothetical protein